jgi:DNA-directed RNA polymerase specialized sigma24 family protein
VTDAVWLTLHELRERLVSTARRHGLTASESEDAASETILKVAAYKDLERDRIKQLAIKVLYRTCVDELRRKGRESAMVRKLDRNLSHSFEERLCESMATASTLRRAASFLSDNELDVVRMTVSGEPHRAISHRLGITVRASEVTLSRARTKLRTFLDRKERAWPS